MARKGSTNRSDFLVGSFLGDGSYSRVYHVLHKPTRKAFACKVMEKNFIMQNNKEESVHMEKRVLSEMRSPFLMQLFYSFHDSRYLYMVIDLCPNGELLRLIRHWYDANDGASALPPRDARFYLVETLCGLQYMHRKG